MLFQCWPPFYGDAGSTLKQHWVNAPCLLGIWGGGPRVVVSTAAFHARVRGSVPGLGGFKETKMFLPHPRVKVSIVGSLRDREVACSASDRQGSNFESCVWRTVSSHSSHHPQEVLLAQFSLYVHKSGLKPDSFHLLGICAQNFTLFTGARKKRGSCKLSGFLVRISEQIDIILRWPIASTLSGVWSIPTVTTTVICSLNRRCSTVGPMLAQCFTCRNVSQTLDDKDARHIRPLIMVCRKLVMVSVISSYFFNILKQMDLI